jgi:hypothetical protein
MISHQDNLKYIHDKINILLNLNIKLDYEYIFDLYCEIQYDLLNHNNLKLDSKYFESNPLNSYAIEFQKFTYKWELFLESIMADYLANIDVCIRSSFLEKIRSHFSIFYNELIKNELSMTHLDNNKTICQVGIGEMPLSLYYLNKNIRNKIIGLDVIQKSIESAKQFITSKTKNNIDNKLQFYCCDGVEYDYKDCDLVIISISVFDKENILAQIKKTNVTKSNFPVIARTTQGLSQYLYPSSLDKIVNYNVRYKVSTGLITSYLLFI